MFDLEELSDEHKAIAEFLYEEFYKAWGDPSADKELWLGVWGHLLLPYDKLTIEHASEFMTLNWQRQPSFPEFRIICDRIINKQRLTEPIEFNVDKVARKLLAIPLEELGCTSYSEFSDACLVAATVASITENERVGISWSKGIANICIEDRAAMIANESFEWLEAASNGKGYWADVLEKSRMANYAVER